MEMSYTKIDLNEWSRGKLFKSYIENMRIVMSLTERPLSPQQSWGEQSEQQRSLKYQK